MATISSTKPPEITILEVFDNVKTGRTKVRYVFRYGIKEKQVEEEITNYDEEEGTPYNVTETVTVYEYKEKIDELEIDTVLKAQIPSILESLYREIAPTLAQLAEYQEQQINIPLDINVDL